MSITEATWERLCWGDRRGDASREKWEVWLSKEAPGRLSA